jgi:transposase
MDASFLRCRAQMRETKLHFPLLRGFPRVYDRRMVRGIIFVIRKALRWHDAPSAYGPHKTIYSRFIRWNRRGVFNQIFAELAAKGGKPERLMTVPHLKGPGRQQAC